MKIIEIIKTIDNNNRQVLQAKLSNEEIGIIKYNSDEKRVVNDHIIDDDNCVEAYNNYACKR